MQAGIHPPSRQVHPQAGTPPRQVHPLAGTHPRQVHTLSRYTPPGRYPLRQVTPLPKRRSLQSTVRILLECFLVLKLVLVINILPLCFWIQDIGNDFTYFIDIGKNNNSRTQISQGFGLPLADKSTPNILKCNTPVVFWLTWDSATLSVSKQKLPPNRAGGALTSD